MIGCFFVASTEIMDFNKKFFYFFKDFLQKHPDDLKKHVVNKVKGLKKFKEIFQKVVKNGQRF